MSNKEITIKLTFRGDDIDRSVRDNPEVIRAVCNQLPALHGDASIQVHVSPREDDGQIEWYMTTASPAGRLSQTVKQSNYGKDIKFGPV